MKNGSRMFPLAFAAILSMAPGVAAAQSVDERWTFQAIVYGYFPDIGGSTSFPRRNESGSINVDNDQLLDSLNFAFMGTFEARRGRWGLFTDFIYLDVSGDSSATRSFTVGGRDIPASASANLDMKIKGVLWTVAAEYLAVAGPSHQMYVLGGARLLDVEETLSYAFSADIGPFVGPGRNGSASVDQSYWDAVIGVKGRFDFGANREWFVPYYADVGTGQSDLT
ncbi:MAG: hypothetical protein U1F41_15100 [Burkholderiales bacterium]